MSVSLESEVLRPYDGIEAFEHFLDDLAIRSGNRPDWERDFEMVLQPEDHRPLAIYFQWSLDLEVTRENLKSVMAHAHLAEDQVSLVGLVRASSAKLVRVFFSEEVSKILEGKGVFDVCVDMESRPRLTPNSPIQLEFYLVLNEAKERVGRFPYAKGTWLCEKKFLIRTDMGSSFPFEWLELTDEIRKEFSLMKRSSIHVRHSMRMDLTPIFADCVDAYLDADIKKQLEEDSRSAISTYLQTQLVGDVLAAACESTMSQIGQSRQDVSWSEIDEGSCLGQLILSIARNCQPSEEELSAQIVFETLLENPQTIRDFVQDASQIKNLIRNLEPDDLAEEEVS